MIHYQKHLMKKLIRIGLVLGICAAIAAEIGLRLAGVVDFPLYEKDAEMGYIQKANQEGVFLNKNRWAINEHHLFGASYDAEIRPSIFLIGDSIVWGGNIYHYNDRLAVSLEQKSGMKVWSAGAGSWSALSVVAYIKRFPDVVAKADVMVLVFNSGDFGKRTVWRSESTHPTRRPVSALVYVFRKYILRKVIKPNRPVVTVKPAIDDAVVSEVAYMVNQTKASKRRILLVLWPSRKELLDEQARIVGLYNQSQAKLAELNTDNVEFVDMLESGILDGDSYKDGIHPTAETVHLFADYINKKISR